MANYNLVVNSTFTPFTYEQYLAPFKEYKEAYQNMEDKISTLQEQADTLEILANNEQDRDVYNQYKAYSEQLHSMANDLATKGLSPNARGLYLGMKSKYAKEIVPIQNAYTARAAEAEAQYKGRAQGMVYENDAANTPLSTYIANPQFKHGMADSSAGYKRVMQAASALSRIAKSDYNLLKSPDPYTARIMQQYGLDPETITQDINQAVEAIQTGDIKNLQNNSTIQSILKTEMQTSGVANWQNPQAQLDYLTKVVPALYTAIGESKVSEMALFGKRLAAQSQAELNLYKEKLKAQKEEEEQAEVERQAVLLKSRDTGERSLSSAVISDKQKKQDVDDYNSFVKNGYVSKNAQLTTNAIRYLKDFIKLGKPRRSTSQYYGPGSDIASPYTSNNIEKLYDLVTSYGITDKDILNSDGRKLGGVNKINNYFKQVSSKDYAPKLRYDASVYASDAMSSSAQSSLKNKLGVLNYGVTLYPVNGIEKDGTITTSSKGKTIGEIMGDDNLNPSSLSVTPSEEGTAIIKIGEDTYKLTQANLRDLLGESTYAAYVAATRRINKATSTGTKAKAILDAKNYLNRAFYGTEGKNYEGDLTEGYDYIPDFIFENGTE